MNEQKNWIEKPYAKFVCHILNIYEGYEWTEGKTESERLELIRKQVEKLLTAARKEEQDKCKEQQLAAVSACNVSYIKGKQAGAREERESWLREINSHMINAEYTDLYQCLISKSWLKQRKNIDKNDIQKHLGGEQK